MLLSAWINKGELIVLTAIISGSCVRHGFLLFLLVFPGAEQLDLSVGDVVCESANGRRATKCISCVPFNPTLTLWFGHAVLEVGHANVISNGLEFGHEVVNARGNGASASGIED